MVSELLFITGNKRKKREVNHVAARYDVKIVFQENSAEEIQHSDPAEVTKTKARDIYANVGQPLLVQDTSWSIPALGGFPGAYMKDVAQWLSAEDWLHLMARHEDRTILLHEHIAYHDGTDVHHFSCSYAGKFIDTPRGIGSGFSNDPLVLMENTTKTLAEIHDDTAPSAINEANLRHWHDFLKWYVSQKANTPS